MQTKKILQLKQNCYSDYLFTGNYGNLKSEYRVSMSIPCRDKNTISLASKTCLNNSNKGRGFHEKQIYATVFKM